MGQPMQSLYIVVNLLAWKLQKKFWISFFSNKKMPVIQWSQSMMACHIVESIHNGTKNIVDSIHDDIKTVCDFKFVEQSGSEND